MSAHARLTPTNTRIYCVCILCILIYFSRNWLIYAILPTDDLMTGDFTLGVIHCWSIWSRICRTLLGDQGRVIIQATGGPLWDKPNRRNMVDVPSNTGKLAALTHCRWHPSLHELTHPSTNQPTVYRSCVCKVIWRKSHAQCQKNKDRLLLAHEVHHPKSIKSAAMETQTIRCTRLAHTGCEPMAYWQGRCLTKSGLINSGIYFSLRAGNVPGQPWVVPVLPYLYHRHSALEQCRPL